MYYDSVRISDPSQNPCLFVHAVYRLMADSTYQVDHPALEPGKMVFVYTDMGQGDLSCLEGSFALEAGTALLFSADAPFCYRTRLEQWNFWWFELAGNSICQRGKQYFLAANDRAVSLCKFILNAMRTNNSSAAAAYLSCFLTWTAELSCNERDFKHLVFDQASAILKEKLLHINIASLAQELHVSTRTLYNLFQYFAGCSPKAYLDTLVLENAKYLLANTTKTVSEIADEIGFSSPFHLSRVFKEATALSPTAYRQKVRFLRDSDNGRADL